MCWLKNRSNINNFTNPYFHFSYNESKILFVLVNLPAQQYSSKTLKNKSPYEWIHGGEVGFFCRCIWLKYNWKIYKDKRIRQEGQGQLQHFSYQLFCWTLIKYIIALMKEYLTLHQFICFIFHQFISNEYEISLNINIVIYLCNVLFVWIYWNELMRLISFNIFKTITKA